MPKSRQLRPNLCVYCNERLATTRDHVVAAQFFPPPRPGNLITVPCCDVCNNRFQPYEEYTCTLFASHAAAIHSSTPAEVLVDKKIFGWLEKRKKLREYLLSQFRTLKNEGVSLPPGVTHGFVGDDARMEPVLEKITKGLYYYKSGVALPSGLEVKTSWNIDDSKYDRCAKPFIDHGIMPFHLGDGVFSYAGMNVKGKPHQSMWLYCFYNAIFVAASTAWRSTFAAADRKARVHKRRQMRKASRLDRQSRHPALRRGKKRK